MTIKVLYLTLFLETNMFSVLRKIIHYAPKLFRFTALSYPWLDINYIKNERIIITSNNSPLLNINDVYAENPVCILNISTAIMFAAMGGALCYSFADPARLTEHYDKIQMFSIGEQPIYRDVCLIRQNDFNTPTYMTDFIKLLKNQYPVNKLNKPL